MQRRLFAIFLLSCTATAANAGETPLYQANPTWVTLAQHPAHTTQTESAPPLALLDLQQRIEGDQLSVYVDTISGIGSSEQLGKMSNITIPWSPDKGDLIVHELSIRRGAETIDLLAKGQRFEVLRREQALEQRELTGVLSATLAVEGLQVGDLLRLRITTTSRDKALGGNVQSVLPLPAAPFRIGQGQARFVWPAKAAPAWKLLASDIVAKPVRKGDNVELTLALPLAKQPDMPENAPQRYKRPPFIELSTFASWSDVSKTFAPLYATDGAIASTGPLAEEVAKIMAADPNPLGRTQRALQLVQDKIRYLAVGMDGGNYMPQSPARTWELRYGDCKAKTLLLLALLHAMKIEAEPVLAHIGLGDLVHERLPSALAFNHVLVRANVNGETYWLDGTGNGTRLADIRDTPPLRTVLPVRTGGADLMPILTHANARPIIDLTIEADESASTDIPSVFDTKAIIRGNMATQIMLANAQFDEIERRQLIATLLRDFVGESQISAMSIVPNSEDGTVLLTARGVTTTRWYIDSRLPKRALANVLYRYEFAPDRGRPAWTTIPVTATDLSGIRYRLKLRLPDKGRGFSIEGAKNFSAEIAGYAINRTVNLADDIVTVDERVEGTGTEVLPAQIPAARDAFATAKANMPIIVAPFDTRRRWDLGSVDPIGATQIAAINTIFTQVIANAPTEVSGYQSRASFRTGIGDRKGALADLTGALKIEPSVGLYLMRANIAYELGDMNAALADAQTALALDPGSPDTIEKVAWYLAEKGELTRAIAMIDERIVLGGTIKSEYQLVKANLLGEWGDAGAAITLLDKLIADKPGTPSLLNARCWIKGIRNIMLDTALKDCTNAIELSENTAPMLDSRAMIWFRMGRFEDSLRDLDTVLASAPNMAQSRYLRAVVLSRLGRKDESAKELAISRQLYGSIDRTNAHYGIKP